MNFIRSSLASKMVMAVTGAALILFVLGHLAGNLLIFAGRDALNAYAEKLKETPALLWPARVGLLVVFVLHLTMAVRLALTNRAARPTRYQYEDVRETSKASRIMLSTGVIILLFLLYHLAHFTFGWTHEAKVDGVPRSYHELEQEYQPTYGGAVKKRQDVHAMVVVGFRNPFIALTYLAAQIALWLHLWHGGSSLFQSLGLGTIRTPWIARIGPVLATGILAGNCAIVVGVLLRWIGAGVPE